MFYTKIVALESIRTPQTYYTKKFDGCILRKQCWTVMQFQKLLELHRSCEGIFPELPFVCRRENWAPGGLITTQPGWTGQRRCLLRSRPGCAPQSPSPPTPRFSVAVWRCLRQDCAHRDGCAAACTWGSIFH